VATGLVNWAITFILSPRILPRLDFEDEIPATCRTMVVIPTILATIAESESSLQELELQYVRNTDPHLTFGLLTDFADADAEHFPDDQPLIDHIIAGIQALNQKYGGQNTAPFYLFHRERKYNPAEGRWMGWERKRGKLMEFNHLL